MRRWNGWGDDRMTYPLHPAGQRFLAQVLGPGRPPQDLSFTQALKQVPPSRLPSHRLVNTEPATRLRFGFGQGFPDWVAARFGPLPLLPQGVAFPEHTEDVQELIDYAQSIGARLLPYGGGTSVVGHLRIAEDRQPVITVALSRMNRLLALDTRNQLATFQAGVRGPDLEAALRARGFTLGHFPQSFEYSTLGGWIATRSVGQESHGYGGIRELFAGGRVETALGPWVLPPFPASAAGPDLREVVLGSEGRLGIITEATVRVRPPPSTYAFRAAFFPEFPHGLAAVKALAQERIPLPLIRLSTPLETRVLLTLSGKERAIRWLERWLAWRGARETKCLLVFAAAGTRQHVKRTLKMASTVIRDHGGVLGPHAVAHQWAKNRFRTPYLRNTLWELGYGVDTVETATTWDKVPALLTAMETALRVALNPIGERVLAFSHLSHVYPTGSSIYTTFVFRLASTAEATLARWEALKAAVSWAIVEYGGTISHQHGVGQDHTPYLEAEKGSPGLALQDALFRAADPDGLFRVR